MDSKDRLEQRIKIYGNITKEIASLSSSTTKKVGCIALRKDFTKMASFGYNGSYKGAPINETTGTEEESLEPGMSGFIHAEINMVAKFQERDPENYIVMLTLSPCKMCMKVLINSGFKHIYWLEEYRDCGHLHILDDCGISYGDLNDLKNDYKLIIRD